MFEELFSSHSMLKKLAIPLSLGILGLILIGYGLITSTTSEQTPDAITFDQPQATTAPKTPITLTIDVEGAVQKPGIYHVAKDARIADAIQAAGGFSEQADHERIAQQLNLAQQLTDGTKVYIPVVGEADAVLGSNTSGTGNGLININTASATDLDTLPGVGAVTAGKIIANRPYQTAEELVKKKIVSQSIFEKIKDQITLY